MNRNIITWQDQPRGQRSSGGTVDGAGKHVGITSTADDYWARLVKYVPIEVISAYILLKGAIESAYKPTEPIGAWMLGALVVLGAVATWFFARKVLRVARWQQLLLSAVAFLVWTFATGGVFATFSWYLPWMTTAVVVIFGVVVRVVELPPLPEVEKAR